MSARKSARLPEAVAKEPERADWKFSWAWRKSTRPASQVSGSSSRTSSRHSSSASSPWSPRTRSPGRVDGPDARPRAVLAPGPAVAWAGRGGVVRPPCPSCARAGGAQSGGRASACPTVVVDRPTYHDAVLLGPGTFPPSAGRNRCPWSRGSVELVPGSRPSTATPILCGSKVVVISWPDGELAPAVDRTSAARLMTRPASTSLQELAGRGLLIRGRVPGVGVVGARLASCTGPEQDRMRRTRGSARDGAWARSAR